MKYLILAMLMMSGYCASSEDLKFFEVKVQLSMTDRDDMIRTFVVQDKQTSRFNMAPAGKRKVMVQITPDSKGRKKMTAVDMKYQVEIEDENGELKQVCDSLMIANKRQPASMSVESKGLPTFSIQMSVKEKTIRPTIVPNEI